MNKIIIGFLFFTCFNTFGQSEFKINTSSNAELTMLLNNSILISENDENYLSVRIYKSPNPEGSAPNSCCEISHDLYIAVSAIDEAPEQNLFTIGSFFNPKFIKWNKIETYNRTFQIEYGSADSRKKINLNVNLKELEIE
jgi:hypothetical protein